MKNRTKNMNSNHVPRLEADGAKVKIIMTVTVMCKIVAKNEHDC